MEIDRTVHIELSKEDLEQLLQGDDLNGNGYKICLNCWDFQFYKYFWKLVKEELGESK